MNSMNILAVYTARMVNNNQPYASFFSILFFSNTCIPNMMATTVAVDVVQNKGNLLANVTMKTITYIYLFKFQ